MKQLTEPIEKSITTWGGKGYTYQVGNKLIDKWQCESCNAVYDEDIKICEACGSDGTEISSSFNHCAISLGGKNEQDYPTEQELKEYNDLLYAMRHPREAGREIKRKKSPYGKPKTKYKKVLMI